MIKTFAVEVPKNLDKVSLILAKFAADGYAPLTSCFLPAPKPTPESNGVIFFVLGDLSPTVEASADEPAKEVEAPSEVATVAGETVTTVVHAPPPNGNGAHLPDPEIVGPGLT